MLRLDFDELMADIWGVLCPIDIVANDLLEKAWYLEVLPRLAAPIVGIAFPTTMACALF
jgi:hypothetical protein